MMAKPNFVMIVTDQHCASWLSCAGHPVVKTPNIDRLAERGVRFREFHTASPVCMPNRASILTGRYPSVHGLKYNGCALSNDARTFVETLADAGYDTAAIGKSHLQPFTGIPAKRLKDKSRDGQDNEAWKHDFAGLDLECPVHYEPDERFQFPDSYYGFRHVDMVTGHGIECGGHYLQWLRKQTPDWYRLREPKEQIGHNYSVPQACRTIMPEELYPTRYIENQTIDWLKQRKEQTDPFFLFVSFPDPHHPFNPPGKYWDRYQPEQFSLATPISAFSMLAPPLAFAHERFKAGGVADTPQEAFAATDRQCLEAMALSAGMLEMIDDAVGSIVDQLEFQGLSDNTVILFTSDHGDYMGDGNLLLKGPWLRQNLHHVPMIWSDPIGSRGETDVLGSSIDFAPTILGRAGVEPYFGLQGRDLLDDVANKGGRDSLLIEFNDNVPRLGLTKPARTRTVYRKDGRLTVFAGEGYGELYDSGLDPSHLSNRWEDAASVDLKATLLEELSVLMAEAMDESPRSFYRA